MNIFRVQCSYSNWLWIKELTAVSDIILFRVGVDYPNEVRYRVHIEAVTLISISIADEGLFYLVAGAKMYSQIRFISQHREVSKFSRDCDII